MPLIKVYAFLQSIRISSQFQKIVAITFCVYWKSLNFREGGREGLRLYDVTPLILFSIEEHSKEPKFNRRLRWFLTGFASAPKKDRVHSTQHCFWIVKKYLKNNLALTLCISKWSWKFCKQRYQKTWSFLSFNWSSNVSLLVPVL